MDFEAAIRIIIRVPFTAEVAELPLALEQKPNGREGLADPRGHEQQAAAVDDQRVAASRTAETDLVKTIRAALADLGDIETVIVEEVREA